MATNSWKLQDAKARFSEVVRQARAGEPQEVTVHGKRAVAVVDIERFEIRPKPGTSFRTMGDFFEASKPYRGCAEGVDLEPRFEMNISPRPIFAPEDEP